MQTNVGSIERVIRIIVGLALLSAFFLAKGTMHWFGLIGIIPLVTGMLGLCPAYLALGIRLEPIKFILK